MSSGVPCSAAALRRPKKVAEAVEYKGYVIRAAPYKNNGHYQTAGSIEREIGGVQKEHRFIRADAYVSYDDAVTFTSTKRVRSLTCRATGFSTKALRRCAGRARRRAEHSERG